MTKVGKDHQVQPLTSTAKPTTTCCSISVPAKLTAEIWKDPLLAGQVSLKCCPFAGSWLEEDYFHLHLISSCGKKPQVPKCRDQKLAPNSILSLHVNDIENFIFFPPVKRDFPGH